MTWNGLFYQCSWPLVAKVIEAPDPEVVGSNPSRFHFHKFTQKGSQLTPYIHTKSPTKFT